eukprot:792199-Lingulodinium_polyedra.AAC.1
MALGTRATRPSPSLLIVVALSVVDYDRALKRNEPKVSNVGHALHENGGRGQDKRFQPGPNGGM